MFFGRVDGVARVVAFVTCGVADDEWVEQSVAAMRALARAGNARTIGLVTASGSGKGVESMGASVRRGVAALTRDVGEETWARLETAMRRSSGEEDVRRALRTCVLALKSHRGGEEKHAVVLTRRDLDLDLDESAAILAAARKAGVTFHVIRSCAHDASHREVLSIRTLCRCCPVNDGGCLSKSLGCCYECGLSIGFNAHLELPKALFEIGICDEDAGDDIDAGVAESQMSAPANQIPSFAHFAGCRNQHAEFAAVSDTDLERLEASSVTSIGLDLPTQTSQREAGSGSEVTATMKRIILNLDDIQLVSKALEEPIASVRCGVLLPCYGRSGRLSGPTTLKVDASTRFTGSALELWLNTDDNLILKFASKHPRRSERIIQRVTRQRADAFIRAQSGDAEDLANAQALGMPTIRHPLPTDTSERAFALALGAGTGRQEKFYWLTTRDLTEAKRELAAFTKMISAPPTLESHTSVPQAILSDMNLVKEAVDRIVHHETMCAGNPEVPQSNLPPESNRTTQRCPKPSKRHPQQTKSDREWLSSVGKTKFEYSVEYSSSLSEPIVEGKSTTTMSPRDDDTPPPPPASTPTEFPREGNDANETPSPLTTTSNQRVNVSNLASLFK